VVAVGDLIAAGEDAGMLCSKAVAPVIVMLGILLSTPGRCALADTKAEDLPTTPTSAEVQSQVLKIFEHLADRIRNQNDFNNALALIRSRISDIENNLNNIQVSKADNQKNYTVYRC